MSEVKTIEKIYDSQIEAKGVQALSDRPNAQTRFGDRGMPSADLKKWFDNLGYLLAGKINEILGVLQSADAPSYISANVPGEKDRNLQDFLDNFAKGGSNYGAAADNLIFVKENENSSYYSLQNVIFSISQKISANVESISKSISWDYIFSDIDDLSDLNTSSGRVLVRNANIKGSVNLHCSEIHFANCTFENDVKISVTSGIRCAISGINLGDEVSLTLTGFSSVSDCVGNNLVLESCKHISRCVFSHASDCANISASVILNPEKSTGVSFISPCSNKGIVTEDNKNKVPLMSPGGELSFEPLAANVSLEMDEKEFKLKLKLLDVDGQMIGQEQEIDLPLESMIMSGKYDAESKNIVLVLRNEETIEFPLADLIDGFASSEYVNQFVVYDKVFTTWEAFEEGIGSATGRVLLNGVELKGAADDGLSITVSENVTCIDCFGVTMADSGVIHIYGNGCTIDGLDIPVDKSVILHNFSVVQNCRVIWVYSCARVVNTTLRVADESALFDVTITGKNTFVRTCSVNGAVVDSTGNVWFSNCHSLSDIVVKNGTPQYVNCTFVNASTCEGYIGAGDDNKVLVAKSDGTKSTASLPQSATLKLEDDTLSVSLTNLDGSEILGGSVSLSEYGKQEAIDDIYSMLTQLGYVGAKIVSDITTVVPVPDNIEVNYAIINRFGGSTTIIEVENDYGNLLPYPYVFISSDTVDEFGKVSYTNTVLSIGFKSVDLPAGTYRAEANCEGETYASCWSVRRNSGNSEWIFGENIDFSLEAETKIELEFFFDADASQFSVSGHCSPVLYRVEDYPDGLAFQPRLYKKLQNAKLQEIKSRGISYEIPKEVQNLDDYGVGIDGYSNTVDLERKKFYRFVSSIVLDGVTEGKKFQYASTYTEGYYYSLDVSPPPATQEGCVWAGGTNIGRVRCNVQYNRVLMFTSVYATVADVNAMLKEQYDKGNPLTVTYTIATPEIEDLPTEMEDLITVEGGGCIEFITDTEAPIPVEVEFRVISEGGSTV